MYMSTQTTKGNLSCELSIYNQSEEPLERLLPKCQKRYVKDREEAKEERINQLNLILSNLLCFIQVISSTTRMKGSEEQHSMA